MIRNVAYIAAVIFLSAALSVSGEERKTQGYLTGSLESNNHIYVEDAATGFTSDFNDYLREGDLFATNDYLKLDYYKGRLSAGMQLEGYFPSLVGYPSVLKKMALSNLYVSWKDDSYSVTAGTFYDQFGSGLLFRSWEDRTLGLNNALVGARASYDFGDLAAVKAFWGIPRLGTGVGDDGFFGFGLTKTWLAGADAGVSLSDIIGLDDMLLSVEGSFLAKHEPAGELAGADPYNFGWSARAAFDYDGYYIRGEYVDAGMQKAGFFGPARGNAQLVEFGYNGNGLGLSVTGRRLERMLRKIYAYSADEAGYYDATNLMAYVPAMCSQYTYMLANLNPYSPKIGDGAAAGEMGGQIDAFYNFRRGTKMGGKRGMKVHANLSGYWTLNEDGGVKGGHRVFTDFSLDVEKYWTKKFKTVLMYSLQDFDDYHSTNGRYIGQSHTIVADMLYKWTSKLSTRMELQYLASKEYQKDWMAALLEVSFAPHWSVFASDMWNHGETGLHYYNAGVSFTMAHLRVAAGYGRYKEGYICSGGVCRAIPAYTGANITLTASF